MNIIKKKFLSLIGACNRGRWDFFFAPDMKYDWGGPFNGQKYRQRIFFDLLYYLPIKAIVETGTFHGTTTALMAATTLPVYTVEIKQRKYCYAKMRFFNNDNVHLHNGDSRSFLEDLNNDKDVPLEGVFFYLDAHWEDDLPLLEELQIIFDKWAHSVVMIDDFQVPETNYGFDDYGKDKSLNLSYIKPVITKHDLSVFFPAVDEKKETGAKRGCVVLSQKFIGKKIESKIKTLSAGDNFGGF